MYGMLQRTGYKGEIRGQLTIDETRLPTWETDITFLGAESSTRPTRRARLCGVRCSTINY